MALAKLYLDRTDNRKGYKYFTFGVRLLLTVIRFWEHRHNSIELLDKTTK